MSKRLSLRKSHRVKWVPDANLCQVKLFLSDDCPSQVGSKAEENLQAKTSWMLHSNEVGFDDPPPGFEGKRLSQTSKHACIPLIKWKHPPRFILNSDWHVVAGELSEESGIQTYRETLVLEAVYPRISSIPPCPTVSPDLEECNYDDREIPLVPVIPIEEEDAVGHESPKCPLLETSNLATMDPEVVAASSMQCIFPVESEPTVNGKSFGTSSTGLEADVVAAASAAFTAIMKSSEKGSMIDTDLLIKILADPTLIGKLSKDFNFLMTRNVTPISVSNAASASVPVPVEEFPLSLCQELLDGNSNMHNLVQKSQPASSTHPTSLVIQVPTEPLCDVKPRIIVPLEQVDENSNQLPKALGSSNTCQVSVTEMPGQSLSMSSLECHALLSKKLDHVNQLLQALVSTRSSLSDLGSKITIPSLNFSSSALDKIIPRKDEELKPPNITLPTSSSWFVGSNGSPRSDLFTQADIYSVHNPVSLESTSQLSLKTTASLLKSTTQTSMLKREPTMALSPKLEDSFSSLGPYMISSTAPSNQSLHEEKRFKESCFLSSSRSPEGFPETSLSSTEALDIKDTGYYRSLVKLHGMDRRETQEYQPNQDSSVSELTAVSGAGEARRKKQKPCKYFNSLTGCKMGSNCPFQHDSSIKLRPASISHDVQSRKKIRLNRGLAGRM